MSLYFSGNTYNCSDAGINTSMSVGASGGFSGTYDAVNHASGSQDSISFENIEYFDITGTFVSDYILTADNDDIVDGFGGNDTMMAKLATTV